MVVKVEKKLVQVLDLCRRGRLVLRRDETVAASVGVQGRQNDANELNAHWLSLGFCILFLSVFSILVLFLVCNILHILRFSLDTQSLDSSLHRSRQFALLDSPPSHFTFVESSIGSLCEEKLRSRFCSFHALCRGVLSFGHFADDDACAGVGLCLLEDVEKKSGQATTTTKSRLFPEEIDNWLLLAPGLVTVSSSLFFQPIINIIIFKSPLVIHHYSSGESGRS
ncbi:Kinesin-like protein KIN-5B [Trichinella spiralis]|uniref:Kinesin-like protein KIN-5B n=1 Tax=Trichinella spiralis TaxID=6334 RepID=A0ABR3KHL3_TRISP